MKRKSPFLRVAAVSALLISVSVWTSESKGQSQSSASDYVGIGSSESKPELNYEQLKALIESKHVTRIEDLLPLLPESLRALPVLMFDSRSLHEASYTNPRAILYGSNAKLVLTFNGDPSQKNYNKLEIMEFDDHSKKFGFREITFPESAGGKVAFSDKNPRNCTQCHGNPPRPIFEPYAMWPGAYGANDGLFPRPGTPEEKGLKSFVQSRKSNPRYRHLVGLETLDRPFDQAGMYFRLRAASGEEGEPNSIFTHRLDMLNYQNMLAQIAASPRFPAFRYALLEAVTLRCMNSANEDILPESVRKNFKTNLWQIKADTQKRNHEQFNRRLEVMNSTSEFRSGYRLNPPDYSSERDPSTHLFRYVVEEGMGLPVASWSMELEKGSYRFTDPGAAGFGEMEPLVVQMLSQDDPELATLYAKAKGPSNEPYCDYIRSKSRKAFEIHKALVRAPLNLGCENQDATVLNENQEATVRSGASVAGQLLERYDAPARAIRQPAQLGACIACHSGSHPVGPVLPLNNPGEMAERLAQKAGTSNRPLIEEIEFRLSEKAGNRRMPLNLIIPDSDQREVLDYFQALLKTRKDGTKGN